MIQILGAQKIILISCAIYALIFTLTSLILDQSLLVLLGNENASLAIKNMIFGLFALVFEVVLLLSIMKGWRYIWKWFPILNHWIFPDLNGVWDVSLTWHWDGRIGTSNAKLTIMQTFDDIGFVMKTDNNSDSRTTLCVPQRNSAIDRIEITYSYLAKNIHPENGITTHEGTAKLEVDINEHHKMKGIYYTDRGTCGTYNLIKMSDMSSAL
ncbi:hypothetical protein [Pseudovibrio sp. Ad26]|uniref:Cap15 family cyclic dinucleotide receptor domain-containing protein n=1 Tax=Pseudovibrio sp. Ad26 TaxID=989410 RepID=UPI0007AE9225|nr:hypothetical protein [Pseudovibrio sp. Ad26]KZL15841.1 hypothetical protein PsAD26_00909 [Pseudovibrio sp. Ad26]